MQPSQRALKEASSGEGHALSERMDIGAIVLAAGCSSRMGRSKPLLPWHGGLTVLETVLRNVLEHPFRTVACVIGHKADEIESAIHIGDPRLVWLRNSDYERGQGTSFTVGARYLQGIGCTSFAVFLGDQPAVRGAPVSRIIEAGAERLAGDRLKGPFAVQPWVGEAPGHPVFLGSTELLDLSVLQGDVGAKALFPQMSEIVRVSMDEPGLTADLDTPEQYEKAIRNL